MNRLNEKALALLMAVSVIPSAYAAQRVKADEYQAQFANISKNSLSSISIDGGRIASLKYLDGDLEVDQDAQTGQVFVRALNNKTSSVFIISENGQTYLLQLTPKAQQGDSIIIDVRTKLNAEITNAPRPPKTITTNSNEYERAVKQLISSILSGKGPEYADQFGVYEVVPLWENSLFVKTFNYVAADMLAEQYQLTNKSAEPMNIREQEFYRKGVLAVSVRKQVLQPGEMTDVVIIKTAERF